MQTLNSILAARARTEGQRTAYTFVTSATDPGVCISYQQLHESSLQIARRVRAMVEPGERALLLYPAGLPFIGAFFACLAAKVIAVPVSLPRRRSPASKIAAIVRDAQPALVLTLATYRPALQDWDLAHLPCLATDELPEPDGPTADSPGHGDQKPGAVAFLQYTSGSTGAPKGVMVTHGNLSHNSACIQAAFQLDESSVSVCWLPHYHDMGLIDGILQPLYSGFHGVLLAPETFGKRPAVWLQLIDRYAATHSGGPNSAYEQCSQRITPQDLEGVDLSRWRSAYCGAEPIRANTLATFSRTFQPFGFQAAALYPCYGMAEATLMISGGQLDQPPTVISLETPNRQLVACGHSWLGSELLIVDPETLSPCEPGQEGEIWTAGPSVALGYWRQEALSRQTFQATPNTGGPTAYLRTGDLGLLRDGQLYIAGRLKDLIIVHGQNHHPQDLEATIQRSHQALAAHRGAAFATGFDTQEKVVVVQEVKRTQLAALPQDALFRAMREAVAREHGVSLAEIVLIRPATLPLTSSGKIQRRQCRELYLQGALAIVAHWSS
ncbi:MAG: fatty acyl-AMP ligase [Cyanobium sp.]